MTPAERFATTQTERMHTMTFTLKSGTNKGNRRIWIEGDRLAVIGLLKGRELFRTMNDESGTMTISTMPTNHGKRHRIAGTDARPILDLCGKWVTAFIGDHSHFTVRVSTHHGGLDLIIEPANV
jgi:hypothetical protein